MYKLTLTDLLLFPLIFLIGFTAILFGLNYAPTDQQTTVIISVEGENK